jgi:hypothetical protein
VDVLRIRVIGGRFIFVFRLYGTKRHFKVGSVEDSFRRTTKVALYTLHLVKPQKRKRSEKEKSHAHQLHNIEVLVSLPRPEHEEDPQHEGLHKDKED